MTQKGLINNLFEFVPPSFFAFALFSLGLPQDHTVELHLYFQTPYQTLHVDLTGPSYSSIPSSLSPKIGIAISPFHRVLSRSELRGIVSFLNICLWRFTVLFSSISCRFSLYHVNFPFPLI